MVRQIKLTRILGLVVCIAVASPVLTVLASLFSPNWEIWTHLSETVLVEYLRNSAVLALEVGLLAGITGTTLGWVSVMMRLPGHRALIVANLLPLAFPAYILGFTYDALLYRGGPLGHWLFEVGLHLPAREAAALVLSLALYPYVYMLARAAFLEQSICALDAARTLGYGPWAVFIHVALPLARPSLVAGVALVMMESLADYGTVQYLGVPTISTGVFRTWFGHYDLNAAAQLASALLIAVFFLLWLERRQRANARFHHATLRYQSLPQKRPGTFSYIVLGGLCWLPALLGFAIPTLSLISQTASLPAFGFDTDFLSLAGNSLVLALSAALLVTLPALFVAYARRRDRSALAQFSQQLGGLGYAAPGTVIAIGALVCTIALDQSIQFIWQSLFSQPAGFTLRIGLFALGLGYLARFFAVAVNAIDAGLGKIRPSLEESARTLGDSGWRLLWRIHIPLMRGSLLTAVVLVFVDVLKELPATLVLRPLDYNTLAVRAFELASDERLRDAAMPSLTIVLVGLIPVILLSRNISDSRAGQAQ